MKKALAIFLLCTPAFAQTKVTPPVEKRPQTLTERLVPLKDVPPVRQFPTFLDPASDVIMTLNATNSASILGVAQVLAKAAPGVKLWVLYPESFDPLTANAKPRVAKVLADLQKDLRKQVPQLSPEFQPHPYLQYPTPQDLGSFFWFSENKQWRAGFVDFHRGGRALKTENWPLQSARIFKAELPLEEPLLLVDRLKSLFDLSLLRLPISAQEFDENSVAHHAGNAVLLPGNSVVKTQTLVTGSSLPEDARTRLSVWMNAKVTTLATGFLQQSVLSSAYAFVPASNSCGYALIVASPLSAMELRKNESFKKSDLDERMQETLFYFAKATDLKADGQWKIEDFETTRAPRTYRPLEISEDFVGQPRYFDFVVQKTLQAELEIQKSARALAASLKASKACAELKIVPVPVIAFIVDENEYFDSENGVGAESRMQLLSPTTNLAVVGSEVLMGDFANSPEAYRKELRERTEKALEAAGVPRLRQHYIASEFYNEGLGSLGGGLLIRRIPPGVVVTSPTQVAPGGR